MQKLRKLNIFQIYRRLPLVIFKSAYLIPQSPYLNPKSAIQNSDIFTMKKKRAAQLIIKRYDLQNQKELSQSYSSFLQHRGQKIKYIYTYILPSFKFQKSLIAASLYFQENQQLIKKQMVQIGKDNKKQSLEKYFKQLPFEVKWIYQRKAETINAHINRNRQIYDKMFKIPQIKQQSTKQLKEKKQKKKKRPIKQALKKKEKKVQNKEEQYNKILSTFLQNHNLSVPQFYAIKKICDNLANCSEVYKDFIGKVVQKNKLKQKQPKSKRIELLLNQSKKLHEQFLKLQSFIQNTTQQDAKVYQELFQMTPNRNFIYDVPLPTFKNYSIQRKEPIVEKLAQQHKKDTNLQETKKEQNKSQEKLTSQTSNNPEKKIQQPSLQKTRQNQSKQLTSSNQNNKNHQKNISSVIDQNDDQEKQMRDEDLNDLQAIQQDYQVLKLLKKIERSGKSPIRVKKIVY